MSIKFKFEAQYVDAWLFVIKMLFRIVSLFVIIYQRCISWDKRWQILFNFMYVIEDLCDIQEIKRAVLTIYVLPQKETYDLKDYNKYEDATSYFLVFMLSIILPTSPRVIFVDTNPLGCYEW